jgi:hypothetical protein
LKRPARGLASGRFTIARRSRLAEVQEVVAAGRVIAVQLNTARLRNCSSAGISPGTIIVVLMGIAFAAGSFAYAATPAGTVIENCATLEYETGAVTSNVVSLTVAQAAGVSLQPNTASQSRAPAEAVYFPAVLVNTGNGTDSFALSIVSQTGWAAEVLLDSNSDGVHQETEQTSISSTGNLAIGQSIRFFAAVHVPAGTSAGLVDNVSVTAQSVYDSSVAASANFSVQVEQAAGAALNPAQALVTAQVGGKACIAFSVMNTGNSEDNISLSANCDLGWPAAVLIDANQDGIHQDSETEQMASTGPLAGGEYRRGFLEVQVPADLAAETQAGIILRAVSALDAGKTAQGSYAVIGKVLAPGDVDGDGNISASDIEAISQMALEAGSWSSEQRRRADVNGDGIVNVLDITCLLNPSASQQSQTPSSGGRQLSLPITGAPAGCIKTLEINLDEGAEVAGIQATLLLDSSLFSVFEVGAGVLMGADSEWQIEFVTDGDEVRLLAYNAAGRSLEPGAGSVLELAGLVSADAQEGQDTVLAWAEPLLSDVFGAAVLPLEALDGLLTVETAGGIAAQVCKHSNAAPIIGAQVGAWLDGELLASGITDNEGNCLLFPLADGSYDVHVSAQGFYGETMPAVAVTAGEMSTVGLGLVAMSKANTGAVEGIVIDDRGRPVSNAQVNIYQGRRKVASFYTDARGYYCRVGLSPGEYLVEVKIKGYAKSTAVVTVYPGEMTFADFLLVSTSAASKRSR